MVSLIMRPLLSLQSRGYRMKPSSLSAKPMLRVTNTWGGTVVEILAIPGVGTMDKEGWANAGPDGWTPATIETMGRVSTLFGSIVVPISGDGEINMTSGMTGGGGGPLPHLCGPIEL